MTVALFVILLVVTKKGVNVRSWPALAALGYSFVLLVVPVYIRGTSLMRLVAHSFEEGAPRYVVMPVLLLTSALAIWIDGSGWRWLTAVFVAHMAVVIAFSFSATNLRSKGPNWSTEVRNARVACEDAPSAAVSVPIAPRGWYVPVSCSELVGE
jgi:hypothetical protein